MPENPLRTRKRKFNSQCARILNHKVKLRHKSPRSRKIELSEFSFFHVRTRDRGGEKSVGYIHMNAPRIGANRIRSRRESFGATRNACRNNFYFGHTCPNIQMIRILQMATNMEHLDIRSYS